MKKSILFLTFLLLFLPKVYSQDFKIGFGGGLTNVLGPDAYTNDISSNGSGFSSEYHLTIKAKLSLPLIPFTPIGFLQYHILSGSESIPLGTIETSQSVFSVGAGVEFEFIPGPLSPFFSLDIAMNNFGDMDREAPQSAGGSVSTSGSSRAGIGIGAGVEFSLLPIDIEVNAKYQFMNLIGKQSDEESINFLTLSLLVYF